MRKALGKDDSRSRLCRAQRSAEAGRPAADHEDVGFGRDPRPPWRQLDPLRIFRPL